MKFDHGEIDFLEKEAVLETLNQGSIGHLGCFSKDDIYVVPITYAFEYPYLYSHSRDGKKILMMRDNPRVCVEVEDVRNLFQWRSVIAWGTYEELHGDDAATAMRVLIQKITHQLVNGKASDLEMDFDAMFEDAVIYRIHINKLSGRSEGKTFIHNTHSLV